MFEWDVCVHGLSVTSSCRTQFAYSPSPTHRRVGARTNVVSLFVLYVYDRKQSVSHEAPPKLTAEGSSVEISAEASRVLEQPEPSSVVAELEHAKKKLALVREIGEALSSGLDLERLLVLIMEKVTLLMEADRSTLYIMSDDRKELWSRVLQGGELREIRLTVGEGIAGWVAASGEKLNIPDAYIDNRFQPSIDLQSGYRTRSILCVPMCNNMGAIVGVAQVLNKKGGPFTADDEVLLSALGSQAAIAIENSKLYHSVVDKNVALTEAQGKLEQKSYELNVLFEIEREMNRAHDLDELLKRIVQRAMEIVGAEEGTIALADKDGKLLRFRTAVGPFAGDLLHRAVPIGDGVIGWVATNRLPLIVNDPGSDSRHNSPDNGDLFASIGLQPRQLMAAPLIAGELTGTIALMDKCDSPKGFSDSDLKLLVLIGGQASKAIQLARRRREHQDQDRLASIGQMLAGVLHDLKTPMTIISGYAQLMAHTDGVKDREAYVEQVLHQFDLMSGMTKEVLAFARGETNLLVRKVFVHRFLAEVKTQLQHALAGHNVVLKIDAQYDGTAYF